MQIPTVFFFFLKKRIRKRPVRNRSKAVDLPHSNFSASATGYVLFYDTPSWQSLAVCVFPRHFYTSHYAIPSEIASRRLRSLSVAPRNGLSENNRSDMSGVDTQVNIEH